MELLRVRKVECWVVHVNRRRGMLLLTEDGATVDIMQEIIVVVRLVWVSAIVVKHIAGFLGGPAFWFGSNTYGGSFGVVGRLIAGTACSPSKVNVGLRRNLRIVVR